MRGLASAGGAFRNDKGEWILGFPRSIGVATVLQSQLWAIFDGISLAWDRGWTEVIVEGDSQGGGGTEKQ